MFKCGKKVIIGQELFTKMQTHKRFTENQNERKALKRQLKGSIVRALGDEWGTYKDGTKAVFDEIIYKATDRGYSFNGIETLAINYKVSESTVKRVLKRLKSTGLVYVAYRKNTNGRGYKTPIVFFLEHPHFKYWKALLSLPCDLVSDLVCVEEKPSETRDNVVKILPTYDLPYKNKKNNILNTFQETSKKIGSKFKKSPYIKYNHHEAPIPKWMKAEMIQTKQQIEEPLSIEKQRYLENLLANL